MTIANTSRWFSPLTALLLVFLVGIGTGWWYWSLLWNDSQACLGTLEGELERGTDSM
jgi:uncharacterized membrane protein AbrB (regulator of aidB expression)